MGWKKLKAQLAQDPEVQAAFAQEFPHAKVADAVAELRARHGLTQLELANRIGSTQSVIARLESGRRAVSTSLLSRIAEALGLEWAPVFHQPVAAALPEPVRVFSYRYGAQFIAYSSAFRINARQGNWSLIVDAGEWPERTTEFVPFSPPDRPAGRPEMTIFANETTRLEPVSC